MFSGQESCAGQGIFHRRTIILIAIGIAIANQLIPEEQAEGLLSLTNNGDGTVTHVWESLNPVGVLPSL